MNEEETQIRAGNARSEPGVRASGPIDETCALPEIRPGQAAHSTDARRQDAGDETVVGGAPRATAAPALGQVGDYELLSEIARGGMGVVYKARQLKLNRLVALKLIRAGEFADDEQVRRFQAEAEAAARLEHPHIVPIYEVGNDGGRHYFSMALVSGAGLHQEVQGAGPLEPRRAAQVVKLVAEAVQFAHERGVIHRDIKPQNILLDEARQPRLTDFGLAKQTKGASDLTATGQIVGTPSYMPPEQASGESERIGPLADVYSLGATLYYLLAGRPPFQASSPLETLQQVLADEPVAPRRLNQSVPRDLETICLKCLEKEPARRYASAAALALDLARFLEDRPIEARPAGALERFGKFARRNRGLVAGASLALAALLLGLLGTSVGMVLALAARNDAIAETVRANAAAEAEKNAAAAARLAEEAKQAEVLASYARLAELASQRGNWREAISNYDKAIAGGAANEIELRIKRAAAQMAVLDLRSAKGEAEALAARQDLGRHAGAVRLLEGMLVQAMERDSTRASELFREALAAGLDPSDEAYAQAMLAEDIHESVRLTRASLSSNPYRHDANVHLLFLLFVTGRMAEFESRVGALDLLFPEDPSVKFLDIIARIAAGKTETIDERLSEMERQISPEQMRQVRSMAALVGDILGMVETLDGQGFTLLTGAQLSAKLTQVIAGATALSQGDLSFASLTRVSGIPPLRKFYDELVPAFFNMCLLRKAAARDGLVRARQHLVLGELLTLEASLTNQLAAGLTDPAAMIAEFEHAANAGQQSLEAPWMIARFSQFGLAPTATAQTMLAHPARRAGGPDLGQRRLALENIRRVLAVSRSGETAAARIMRQQLPRMASNAQELMELDLALELIAECERHDPNNPQVLKLHAETALLLGANSAAIGACERLIKLRPQETEARQLRQFAINAAGALAAAARAAPPQVRYVRAGAAPGGDGKTWGTAYRDLQDALREARSGPGRIDQIWVARGVYRPAGPEGPREATFEIPPGVSVLGGFSGGETNVWLRAAGEHPTILSGDLRGNDLPGEDATRSENCRHVVTVRGGDNRTLIDGFVITGGFADSQAQDNAEEGERPADVAERGGGMTILQGSPLVQNCEFRENYAVEGGGVYCLSGAPYFTECRFVRNRARLGGGARYFSPDAEQATPVVFRESLFEENLAEAGGGLAVQGVKQLLLFDNLFRRNRAETAGSARGLGAGGAANLAQTHLVAVNCVFDRNAAAKTGGALHLQDASAARILFATFSGNSTLEGGGACRAERCAPLVQNSILWGNGEQPLSAAEGEFSIRAACVEGGHAGEQIQTADPAFVDAAAGALWLSKNSPCKDAGDARLFVPDALDVNENRNITEPHPYDFDGRPRAVGRPDLGAFEFSERPDAERRAAEWVLKQGGTVRLASQRRHVLAQSAEALPAEPFTVLGIDLGGREFDELGLVCLADLSRLRTLELQDAKLTSAGWSYISSLLHLRYMNLRNTSLPVWALGAIKASLAQCQIEE